jgi:hypothetical protein
MKTRFKNSFTHPILLVASLSIAFMNPAQAQTTLSAPAAPSESPAPDNRPVNVGKLSPEELRARQKAEASKKAAQAAPATAEAGSTAATVAAPAAAKTEPRTPIDYIKDNEWQKHAEIRSGNVTVLRRSTDDPPKPDETVILRWRTPREFSNNACTSSKSHTPNVNPFYSNSKQ